MGNTMVKSQTEQVKKFLEFTVQQLNQFLNQTTLSSLLAEQEGDTSFYEGLLSNVRRIAVFCEDGLDACRVILGTEPFNKAAAEKTLYSIYHHCIEEFFSPKSDLWYEDSRSAYTGRNSIKFRQTPPPSIKTLLCSLESKFQLIREELEYFETDYRTKMLQSK
jgi:hypothetical protein